MPLDGLGDNFGDTLGDSPVSFSGTLHGPSSIVGPVYVLNAIGRYLKRGDTLPWLTAILCDASGPVDLTNAISIQFMADGVSTSNTISQPTSVANASIGQIIYKWQVADTSIIDDYAGRFVVTYSNGNIITFPAYEPVAIKISPSVA